MILWATIAALTALSTGVILAALLRRPRAAVQRAEHDLEVFRAQLRELDRERERGQIAPAEAEAARLEIQHRLLAADAAREAGQPTRVVPRPSRGLALALGILVPAAAIAAYLALGSPQTPSVTLAERRAPDAPAAAGADGAGGLPDVDTMIARVERRLAEAPDDLQGWLILARSQMALGRYGKAVAAYDRAVALEDAIAALHAGRAEALIMQAGGAVTEAARAALDRALALDPAEPRARYYSAVAQRQAGRPEAALQAMAKLLRDAPPEAPWLAVVREQAVALARELGHDPAAVLPPASSAQAGTEDPAATVQRLETRLRQTPKDFRGWIALARARAAQGDRAGARQALAEGRAAYPGAPFVEQQFAAAAAELGVDDAEAPARGPDSEDIAAAQEMTPEAQAAMIRGMVEGLAARLEEQPDDLSGWRMLARSYNVLGEGEKAVAAYRRVLALDERDPDALFVLGEAARRAGDRAQAEVYWRRLLAQLPQDSPDRIALQDRIDGLRAQE